MPFASQQAVPLLPFGLIVAASVLIAAAGYVINDYYDVSIDHINKPEKVVIGKAVSTRRAVFFYFFLNAGGLLASVRVSLLVDNGWIAVLNGLAILLLWLYSAFLKKALLIGNLVVSALTAWTLFVLFVASPHTSHLFLQVTGLFAGFAFMLSLIREMVKDIEDVRGDAAAHATTLPLVQGVEAAKRWAYVCLLITGVGVIIVLRHVKWWPVTLYGTLAILFPLFLTFQNLKLAKVARDYHRVSLLLKLVMLAGILSMLFFLC